MTNKKSLKRAIIVAFMSVVLCVSMLLGATFAWFTDSATSSGNVIKAGTLDIAFEEWDGDEWVDATTDPIFSYDKWEPGYTQIVNLRVVNKGTLSLKWQATITTEDELSALADVINVYVRSDDQADTVRGYIDSITDRTQFDDLATQGFFKKYTLRQFIENVTVMTKGTMVAGQKSYLGIVVQMSTEAGSEYAGLDLGGKFDITVIATQVADESDSFDPSYDDNVPFPDATGKIVNDNSVSHALKTTSVGVEIPAGAPTGSYTLEVLKGDESTDAITNETTVEYDITLKKDGQKVTDTGVEYTVTIATKKDAAIRKVTHNGAEITNYTYDPVSGELTFTTTSFSPFTISYATYNYMVGDEGFDVFADAVAYLKANGGELVLYNNVDESLTLDHPVAGAENVVIDLNGFSMVSDESTLWVSDGYNVTIKDSKGTGVITTTATASNMADIFTGALQIERGGKVTLESGKITSPICAVSVGRYANSNYEEFIMNGGTLEIPNRTGGGAALYVVDVNSKAVINGGEVLCHKEDGGDCWLMYSWGSVQINDGTFKGPFGGAVTIKQGDFSFGAYEDSLNVALVDAWSYAKKEDGITKVRPIQASGLQGDGSTANPYLINNLDELLWFSAYTETCRQDGASQYAGKTVKLNADIDLEGIYWNPIGSMTKDHGSFYGTFDGDNHTISNLYVHTDGGAGFFAKTSGIGDGPQAVVKNLHFVNADVCSVSASYSGNGSYVGVVVANGGQNTLLSNVTVKGYVYVEGYGYVGGLVGHGYVDLENCVVDAEEDSYVISNYWCGGGAIGYAGEGACYIKDVTVKGLMVWGAYGGAGAVVGFLQTGNTLENVHAENVEVTSASNNCMGYIAGLGEESTYINVTMKNVTSTANGDAITSTDNANITVIE